MAWHGREWREPYHDQRMEAADIVLEALKTDNAVNAMEADYLDVETDLHAMTQEFRPAAPLCSRCTKPINGIVFIQLGYVHYGCVNVKALPWIRTPWEL